MPTLALDSTCIAGVVVAGCGGGGGGSCGEGGGGEGGADDAGLPLRCHISGEEPSGGSKK